MPLILFVAFIVVPLVELFVIGQVADVIGLGWTIVVLVADSLLGAVLVRNEGRRAWRAFREALSGGRWPGDEVAQGALVLVGGALLLTPGFVTDVVGLLLVAPPSRRMLSKVLRVRMGGPMVVVDGLGSRWNAARDRAEHAAGASPRRDPGDGDGPATVDVEVLRVERDDERDDERGAGSDGPPAVGGT
jgi:UPF0716 protein FxsA